MATSPAKRLKSKRLLFSGAVLFAFLFAFGSTGAVVSRGQQSDAPLYKNKSAGIEERINDLLPRLTLEEKITMIHGDPSSGMDTLPIARLGISRISTTDGPHGVRWDKSTAFPPGITIASTWNDELVHKLGVALARETLAHGRNTILGPCVNIHRIPFGGRNFESYSEDPYLAGRIAVAYIKGVQSQNVIATVKHYAANNQEVERGTISVDIDERALREIYLPHFKAAIQEGGSYSIMCSYNRLNGVYACENKFLMTDILKNEWGFKGFAMSDWGAVHSTVNTAMNGLDLEMPSGAFTGADLLAAVREGKVPESVIDDKVRRLLWVMMKTGIFDRKVYVEKSWLDSAEHRAIALDVARESITLLKNKGGLLPLDRNKIKRIAVIGPNAAVARMGGGGSSSVTPTYSVSPLEGILKQVGEGVEVKYAQGVDLFLPGDFEIIPSTYLIPADDVSGESGLKADYYNGGSVSGKPAHTRVDQQLDFMWMWDAPAPGVRHDGFSVRWRGKLVPPVSGTYKITAIGNGVFQLHINGKPRAHNVSSMGNISKTISIDMKVGESYDIRFDYTCTGGEAIARLGWSPPGRDPVAEAAKLAKESDVALVFVGLDSRFEGEGRDRPAKDNIQLPDHQNRLVEAVAAANPKTIVVLINGTPLKMDRWLDKVPSVVEAWYPGEEGGRAIAETLFGDVNPSGKLTITYPKSWEQCPAYGDYPGKDGAVHYKEGIFVGYRYFDTKNVEPAFPFGFGLSYTAFAYSGLKIQPSVLTSKDKTFTATVQVKNTGARAGKEVVQLYVKDEQSSVERPSHELKSFKKIYLKPGETKTVSMTLDRDALSFYDPTKKQWVAEPGAFEIQVGASSRDIRQKAKLNLK